MEELFVLDLTDEKYELDPHAALKEARRRAPVARMLPFGTLTVLSMSECNRLLRDLWLGAAGTRTLGMAGIGEGPIWEWWKLILFQTNPPVFRRALTPAPRAKAKPKSPPTLSVQRFAANGAQILQPRLPLLGFGRLTV